MYTMENVFVAEQMVYDHSTPIPSENEGSNSESEEVENGNEDVDDSIADPDFVPEAGPSDFDNSAADPDNEQEGINDRTGGADEPNPNNLNKQKETGKRKKRKAPETWKKNIRKTKRQNGEEYINTLGQLQSKKVPKAACNCKLKCYEKLDAAARITICSDFWKLGSLNRQHDFIANSITKTVTVSSRKESSRRKHTLKYTLPYQTIKHTVCKVAYLNTLNISDKKVRVALSKSSRSAITMPSPDKRGTHRPHNKLSNDTIAGVNEHIDLFPRVPSHWCRRDTSKEYLEPNLNKEIMYKLYLEYCQEKKIKPAGKTVYKEACIKKNIGFYQPKKDQCWCYNFLKEGAENSEKSVAEYELHMKRKDAANRQKDADKRMAQEDKTIVAVNFDLQAVLNCPIFFGKPIFYKRKYAVYNLTIYEVAAKQGHAFLWDETNGNRGSNEIATCVLKFILSLPTETKHLILYSDSCPGQNRNAVIACMLQYSLSVHETLETIRMNYLEPGHTHMECDSMHAAIERASEYAKIYLPNDWENVVRMSKKRGLSNKVTLLTLSEFLDFKSFRNSKMPNVHKATDSTNLNWKEVKCLLFKKDSPNSLFFKCEYWDEFKELYTDLRRGRRISGNSVPLPAYKEHIPITKLKYDDLVELCKSNVIKKEYHTFYLNLPHQGKNTNDSNDDDEINLQVMREKLLSKRRK